MNAKYKKNGCGEELSKDVPRISGRSATTARRPTMLNVAARVLNIIFLPINLLVMVMVTVVAVLCGKIVSQVRR